MNKEHASRAAALVIEVYAEMKALAETRGLEVTKDNEGFTIHYPGFRGNHTYEYADMIRMALIGAVTGSKFKINVLPQYGDLLQPELIQDESGIVPPVLSMFKDMNLTLDEFIAGESDLAPKYIFWRIPGDPGLNATKHERAVFALLENVFENGRFRSRSLVQNHIIYLYLTGNIKYVVKELDDRGFYVDLDPSSDSKYLELCNDALGLIRIALNDVIS